MCPVPYRPRSPLSRRRNIVSYDDDDSTVCSDDSSFISTEYRNHTWRRQEYGPIFYLKEGEESNKVYEAWNILYFPSRKDAVGGFKALGLDVQEYQELEARVSTVPQSSEQSTLADEHCNAVKQYRDKHRRGWAGRIFRGKEKTYEEHLDAICSTLPMEVQRAITALLLDRGRATSTPYRTRTWTLASLREQSFLRFATTDHPEAQQSHRRLWKKKKTAENQALKISLIIQGGQTGVSKTAEGVATFHQNENPWLLADNAEANEMARERRRQQEASRSKRDESPPSYRSARSTSVSPHRERRSFASPPSYTSRPERSRGRSLSSEQVRHRVQRRDRSEDSMSDAWPSPFDRDPYGAPTPPETFTPPPGVSAYSRPSVIPPPLPTQFHPGPPMAPRYLPPPPPPPAMLPCRACQTVAPCSHFSRLFQCHRPLLNTMNNIPTHPPCVFCFGGMNPPPPPPPPPPMPSYYPGPMPMGPAPPPPPPQFGGMWPAPRPIVPPSEFGERCGTSMLMATPPPPRRQPPQMFGSEVEYPLHACSLSTSRDALVDFDFDAFLNDSGSSSSSSSSSRSSSPVRPRRTVRRHYRPAQVQDADDISVTATEVSVEDARSIRNDNEGRVPRLEEGKEGSNAVV